MENVVKLKEGGYKNEEKNIGNSNCMCIDDFHSVGNKCPR